MTAQMIERQSSPCRHPGRRNRSRFSGQIRLGSLPMADGDDSSDRFHRHAETEEVLL